MMLIKARCVVKHSDVFVQIVTVFFFNILTTRAFFYHVRADKKKPIKHPSFATKTTNSDRPVIISFLHRFGRIRRHTCLKHTSRLTILDHETRNPLIEIVAKYRIVRVSFLNYYYYAA